jgi:polysaccharide export outer membrane protein
LSAAVPLLLLSTVSVAPCFAQNFAAAASTPASDTSAPVPATTTELKRNPIEILREVEPAEDAPYELGKGDQITVEVVGRPELTSQQIIGPDGQITMPSAGSVKVIDMTREQAADAIKTKLSEDYKDVSVSVRVDKYGSNHIILLGAVANPGVMTFEGTPLLLEVISRGGVVSQATPAGGKVSAPIGPATLPDECVIYRGKGKDSLVLHVELKKLLEEDTNLADYRLKRDDIVYVPGADKYVSVFGEVAQPGTLRLDSSSTLPKLLAQAGGPVEKAGHNPMIQVIHRGDDKSPARTQLISYQDILGPKPIDITLHSGDIIYVPESGFNRFGYTMQQIAPLVNLVTIGGLLR